MDVREKLAKLVEYMDGVCPSGVSSYNCQHKDIGEGCSIQAKVDYLIKGGVTVQERGSWKYYHKQNKAVCTNCSFERDLDANFGKAITCPNCGAKMDGGNEDA